MKHLPAMILALSLHQGDTLAAEAVRLRTDKTLRDLETDRLSGGNVALWYRPETLSSPEMLSGMDLWKPGLLRLPGGSWSDEFLWNGNGVRVGDVFNNTKRVNGRWQIDYSSYAPGFRLAKTDGTLAEFHGNCDVKALHDYVRSRGAEAIVTVNAGTGTPEMAAEWVRWAKASNYKVAYWEIGNELDGEWEMGHALPDGKRMNAAEYVSRFKTFAKAMKAADPSIKTGGPTCSSDQLPFVEELIRDGGDLVNFVSFHTYPVLGGRTDERARIASADDVKKAVGKIRSWIAAYQPQRKDRIAIGVTEWHKQVMETRATVDLTSGIWGCLFIGAMAESGVDFANVWDMFSNTPTGGHGLFDKNGRSPRAMFHALSLWRGMSGRMIETEATGGLRVFATVRSDSTELLIVNPERAVSGFTLSLDGKSINRTLAAKRFSQREYFWNPIKNAPEWTLAPRPIQLKPDDGGSYPISPMSALRLSLPAQESADTQVPSLSAGKPLLEILLPDSAPADLPVEGFVVVRDAATGGPYLGTLPEVKLETSGGATLNQSVLDVSECVGRFELSAAKPGSVSLKASADGTPAVTRTLTLTAVEERSDVFWTFADEASVSSMETNFALSLDRSARPNQTVAAAVLSNATGQAQKNTLAAIKQMPQSLDKARIGGFCGKIGASADLASEDPKAAVQIVLQSNLNHWIQIGEVPLSEIKGVWKDVKLRFTDPSVLDAMRDVYSVRMQLRAHKPVSGRIYFDDLGFILRKN